MQGFRYGSPPAPKQSVPDVARCSVPLRCERPALHSLNVSASLRSLRADSHSSALSVASFGRIERHRIVSRFGRARHVHPVKRLKGSTSPTLRGSALLHFATSHLCESTPSGYRLGIGLLLHSFLMVGCRHLASPLFMSLVSRFRVSPSNRTPYGDCIFGAVKDRPPSFRLTACLRFALSGFAKVTPTRSAHANSKIGLVGLCGRPTFRYDGASTEGTSGRL